MSITTVSARDFARDLARAKRAAESGPVIVTDRGQPAYALLKIDDYRRLSGAHQPSLLALMQAMAPDVEAGASFDFEPPRLDDNSLKPADWA